MTKLYLELEKSRKKSLFYSRTVNAASGTTSSTANQELSCLWHFQRASDSKDTSGMAQPGGALSRLRSGAALGPAAEAQRPRASDHTVRRSRGEKRNPNSCGTG